MNTGFEDLTPNVFLSVLEDALSRKLTGLARPMPSYINRVYEISDEEGNGFVAKFYRPDRWSDEALMDEHDFLFDCADVDIPVICPQVLSGGNTLNFFENIPFCVFPKKGGRQFDIENEEGFIRAGSLLARIHNAGGKKQAGSRLFLTPDQTTEQYTDLLLENHLTPLWHDKFRDICHRIIDTIAPFFDGLDNIRIHGDFHTGNILQRPEEGLFVIDFDDMMNGPAVQDFWLLLPDHFPVSRHYLDLLLKGYSRFRDFDPASFRIIEGLRAMRMIYFLAWCAMQREDARFVEKHPDWGSDTFWSKEVRDLNVQYENVLECLKA
ncbi:MAG: serine/threonine protein kinase [Fibrobacterota bacterium]